ncbi:excisionase [Mixta intestinalis]|uniref:Excisionase-like domain-containing protein n=1 Tax=Mixta intestinalis TaxID=1615494 RepID=A0A6P1PZX6_9GAMM|nr:excisionase [Mixta intestinalis]QHM71328.1 hypothetical protein C7M51_01614 [Mixta intestinalis]
MQITLTEWADNHYTTPPNINTLRRWARNGNFYPPPEKHGRQYYIDPNAIYVKPNDLMLGMKIKKSQSDLPAKNDFMRKVIRDTEKKVRRQSA